MAKTNSMHKFMKNWVVILASILFLGKAYTQERLEPKLIWQKSFSEKIRDFSMSYDGSVILVQTETVGKNPTGNFIAKYYLLNKKGEVQKVMTGKLTSGGWVLSPDGKEMIDENGRVFDKDNKTIRTTNLELLITEISYPVFSPSKKFVAIQGATEAEGKPSIEMYDLLTGKLLWEYKPFPLPDTWGGFAIRFVNDERVVVYEGRTVRLLDVKTGEKIWKTVVFGDTDIITAFSVGPDITMNDSADFAIVKLIHGYVASVTRDGKFRWGKILGDRYAANMALSPSGKFLSIITVPSWEPGIKYPPGFLSLINNMNGEVIWSKELAIGFGNAGMYGKKVATFITEKYLIYTSQALKEEESKGKFLLLFDNQSSEVIWKWKPEQSNAGPFELSENKKKLLIIGGENTLYLFDISNFLEGVK